jgi:hypothetical protein
MLHQLRGYTVTEQQNYACGALAEPQMRWLHASHYTEMLWGSKSRFIHLVCATVFIHLKTNIQQTLANME